MITIEQRKSEKCPGLTSLFVTATQYSEAFVNILQNLSFRIYNKDTKEWETGLTFLAELITLFSQIDDVELKLLADAEQPNKKYELSKIKKELFYYQKDAVNYGLNHDKWLLLDAPGLGKTLTIISLANELRLQGKIKNCLIICGINALKINWKKEILKHSDLSCRILGESINSKGNLKIGGVAERLEQLKNPIDEFFTITNIETIRDDKIIKELTNKKAKNKFDLIVVDECHKVKDSQSHQAKSLLKLDSKYKIGLTGTLIMNNPLDAYTSLKWLGKENCTLTNLKGFYVIFGGPFNNIPTGFKNLDVLKEQIESCSLRRTKDLLNLPEKTVINRYIELDPSHRKFYDEIVRGVVGDVDKVQISTANILAMVSRLRQATALPSILSTANITPTKVNYAVNLTDEIIENGEKIVIFSTFKDTCYTLADKLAKYNPVVCTGNENDNTINENIEKFQTDDNCKVFIGTWQKCGTGITLTSATSMIFIDTPFTSADFVQAQDRIYRIGTTKPVTIYNLICENTIDERVNEIVEDKAAISDFIVDNHISKNGMESLKKYVMDLV